MSSCLYMSTQKSVTVSLACSLDHDLEQCMEKTKGKGDSVKPVKKKTKKDRRSSNGASSYLLSYFNTCKTSHIVFR